MAGQAKTFKTIKTPEAMAYVNVINGELKAREVIFRDTATTVHFTMEYPKGENFQFVSSSYLMDEDGNCYPLRSAEGIALNTWVQSPESGVTDFTMHFEPMPKEVQEFDFIDGDGTGTYKLLGIHDKKYKIVPPTFQELTTANPYTVPADWFKTDTITIQGHIEGRILVIDFWGMGCGPCRGAIQDSKNLRAEIAKRDDVKLVFIAGERTTEGSDAYKKYVAKWLADEETVCVTDADFTRLQELFRFNGIPHYETITPDCRRVREDLRISGYEIFENQLQRLLEKLR